MKNMISCAVLLLLMVQNAFSQLSGQLQDEKGQALGYANVTVLQAADSSVVSGGLTDEAGYFKIPAPANGTYLLRLTALGFTTKYSKPFQLERTTSKLDFGVLSLQENVKVLGVVTVKALRPTLTVEPDKMVVNVEGTALASGSTAYQVLEKAPGVWVDQDGNIQLNGKAGARVMIDGRPVYLSGKELQGLLESMPAENVKSIELISNPSAKYEAAGSGGIINIQLKTSTQLGMNGSVYAGFQHNGTSGYNAGLNLNYMRGKWNSYITADMAERPRLREGVMNREFHANGANTRFHQLRDEELTIKSPSLRLGTDYDLNERHSLGGILHLNPNTLERKFYSGSDLRDQAKTEHLFVNAGNFNTIRNASNAFNLHYNGQFAASTALALSLDYIQLDNRAKARYENRFENMKTGQILTEMLRTNNPGTYNIYAANADLSLPLTGKTKLELGTKASHVLSGNELDFYLVDPEQGDQLDPSRSNHYRYTERILAGYAHVSTAFEEKWRLQAGVRGEHTVGEGNSEDGEKIVKRYFDLFPSFFLTHAVSSRYQVNYTYNRRIDRPNYRSLNPFILYQDPYSWAEGNPDLKPQYTNSFQVTQTLDNTYSLMLGYALTKDLFAETPEQRSEDNTTVYKECNIDQAEFFSATLVAPVKVLPGWNISNNLVAGQQKNKVYLQEQELENNQFILTAQSTHSVLLPWGLQLQATGAYKSPTTYGIYRFGSQWWLDAGLKKSLLNDLLDVSLAGTDLFRSHKHRGDASYNGNVFSFVNYFMARSIKLNLRYTFKQGQDLKTKSRKITLEELNRAKG